MGSFVKLEYYKLLSKIYRSKILSILCKHDAIRINNSDVHMHFLTRMYQNIQHDSSFIDAFFLRVRDVPIPALVSTIVTSLVQDV